MDCGAPAEEIDHVLGRSAPEGDDPRYLEAVCRRCHRARHASPEGATSYGGRVSVATCPPGQRVRAVSPTVAFFWETFAARRVSLTMAYRTAMKSPGASPAAPLLPLKTVLLSNVNGAPPKTNVPVPSGWTRSRRGFPRKCLGLAALRLLAQPSPCSAKRAQPTTPSSSRILPRVVPSAIRAPAGIGRS